MGKGNTKAKRKDRKEKKERNEQKDISLVLVPDMTEQIKEIIATRFNLKASIAIFLVLVLLVTSGTLAVRLYFENRKLEKDILQLSEINANQNNLIQEKNYEISELSKKEENINKSIQDVMSKYKEMADAYMTGSGVSSKTSRAGNRNQSAFMSDISELKSKIDNLNDMNYSTNSSLPDTSATEKKLKDYVDSIPTLMPTLGRISSKFGGRPDPFQSRTKFHSGLDVAAGTGAAIKASANGTVTFSGWYSGYGNAVIVSHGHGVSTLYGHASKLLVKKGAKVKKGDVIARVGNTGRSTGPHLHFEVRINDTPVDPLKYLNNR